MPLDALADARFAETAPHWDSEEPYQLHATLGDREWKREAENYGDWYDVGAVLDLLNEMAAAIESRQSNAFVRLNPPGSEDPSLYK